MRLLSTVLENSYLRFVFYYRGYCNIEFLEIPLQTTLDSVFPKGFFQGISYQEKYINSMIELRILLENSDSENAKLYKEILANANFCNVAVSSQAIRKIIDRKMNIYDNKLKRFLFKTTSKYRMGYCMEKGGKYVKFDDNEQRFNTSENFVLVSCDTVIMFNGELVTKIKQINLNSCEMPKLKWYDGVPGCGKHS